MDIKGKNIIITGASSGLGAATAINLRQSGATLCLIGRDENKLKKVNGLMCSQDNLLISTDLNEFKNYKQLFNDIFDKLGKFDGLVHFAGISRMLPLKIMRVEILKDILNINLIAFFELVKFFTKKNFVNDNGASVVGISSVMGLQGAPAMSGYGASKAGIDSAVRSLACEFAPRKIRFNSIAPGYVVTDITTALRQDKNRSADLMARIPMKRWGTIDDMAGAAVYLASDASDYVNGELLNVDGGWMGR